MAELTPMKKQYLEIKRNTPTACCFFRLGTFTRCSTTTQMLPRVRTHLTPTTRDRNKPSSARPCAACRITPPRAYIARLIAKGYKVAICEQIEDPAQAKGLVKREVIRVVTPGTVTESSMLEEGKNNYSARSTPQPARARPRSATYLHGRVLLRGLSRADAVRNTRSTSLAASRRASSSSRARPRGPLAIFRRESSSLREHGRARFESGLRCAAP